MRQNNMWFRWFVATGLVVAPVSLTAVPVAGQTSDQPSASATSSEAKPTTEPVFRVSKLSDASRDRDEQKIFQPEAIKKNVADVAAPEIAAEGHSLDRAIQTAYDALADMRSNVQDYTAIMVKRERVNNVIADPEYMKLKVRCPRTTDHGKAPFSVYMKFLRPKAMAGREVIWVDGKNQNRLCAHESGGLIGMKRFNLDPDGWIAMQNNRYPIYDAGIENLIIKLIEKAERDRNVGPCQVVYREGAMINKRSCTLIELTHDQRKAPYEFHKAQVFIDDELGLPVRYAAYDWPASPGGEPELLEEYTYVNVAVNVGLTDYDFDPNNPKYHYPGR